MWFFFFSLTSSTMTVKEKKNQKGTEEKAINSHVRTPRFTHSLCLMPMPNDTHLGEQKT